MIKGLHHIGIASKNLAKDIAFYEMFGYTPEGKIREDTDAKICVQFLQAANQPLLELVADLDKDGPIAVHLQARRKIFHFAYETDNLEADARQMIEEKGAIYLIPITQVKDVASPIKAWCYLAFRNGMIIELLETRKQ